MHLQRAPDIFGVVFAKITGPFFLFEPLFRNFFQRAFILESLLLCNLLQMSLRVDALHE
ncbi:hypothetical protein SOJ85_000034 [Cronobacter turicensis]|nr:hypothetical protein [Cronobacter turicensis]